MFFKGSVSFKVLFVHFKQNILGNINFFTELKNLFSLQSYNHFSFLKKTPDFQRNSIIRKNKVTILHFVTSQRVSFFFKYINSSINSSCFQILHSSSLMWTIRKFNFLLEIKDLGTSYQTPDDFIEIALKLKPQLQMTSNFAERKIHICRARFK